MYFSLYKVDCPYCGTKHRMNKRGICPRCGKRYILAEPPKKKKTGESKFKTAAREIYDFISNSGARQKKILAFLAVVMAALLVLLVSAAVNLSKAEADAYEPRERSFVPVIYKSGSTAHLLFHDGKTVELGIGDVLKYDASHNGDIMYLLFSGRITADVDSANMGDYIIRIQDGKNLEIIAKGPVGEVGYVAGGDCEYAYSVIPTPKKAVEAETPAAPERHETVGVGINGAATGISKPLDAEKVPAASVAVNDTEQKDGFVPDNSPNLKDHEAEETADYEGYYTVYFNHRKKPRYTVTETASSVELAMSPNGRYLLFCDDDPEGSEIVRFKASGKSLEETGVKNSSPISIDNKGRSFTYFKVDAEGKSKFSLVRGSETFTHTLGASPVREIVFSDDMRSFAIISETGVVFKAEDDYEYRSVTFDTASDFGLVKDVYLDISFGVPEKLGKVTVLEGDLFPYFYYDRPNQTLYRISANGSKVPHFDISVESAVMTDEGDIAFTSGGKLYTGKLTEGKNRMKVLAEDFSYELYGISPDGKIVLCTDKSDGRLFTVRSGSAPEPLTQNAGFVKFSPDSRIVFYTKDDEAYMKKSSGTPRLIDSSIVPEFTSLSTTDFSQFVYAKDMGEDSTGNRKYSLYIYRDGKPMFVTENLTEFHTNRGAGFTHIRSNGFSPASSAEKEQEKLPSLLVGEGASK